jgi:hypothetical protein
MQSKLHTNLTLLALLGITLLLSYYVSPFFKSPQTDRQVFVYGGMAILKGDVPYKDFFDHKPPLIYLILAIGWNFKWWGIWAVGVVTKWIAASFLYKAAQLYNTPLKFLVPLTFLTTLLDPFLIENGTFTREYSAVFMAITGSVMLINPNKKYLLIGFLLGLTFFTQQEEGIFLAPFIIWHISYQNNQLVPFRLFLQRSAKLILGFLFVLLPLVSWMYLKNGLQAFWEHAFVFNFMIYRPSIPLEVRLENSIKLFYHSRVGFFIVGFSMMHLFFILKKSNNVFHLMSIISLVSTAILKCLFSRLGEEYNTQHYFLGYSVLFAISALFILKDLQQLMKLPTWNFAVVLAFVFATYFLWENAVSSKFTIKEDHYYKQIQEIIPYVKDVKDKDGQVFVFRNTSYLNINIELNSLSPSKWIYTTTYNSQIPSYRIEYVVYDIISSLEKHKTSFIVDLSVEFPLANQSIRNEWNRYLTEKYFIVKSTKDFTILKRNDS